MKIYLIGSLRNPEIPRIGDELRNIGIDVFDDWFAGGPIADDSWQEYEKGRGRSYQSALYGPAARNVFNFDHTNLMASHGAILVLPAGKSGHLELGFMAGLGRFTGVLFPPEEQLAKLPDNWEWLAGLYEGEGTLTRNNTKANTAAQLSITMKDKDIIERCAQVTKVGFLQGPYVRNNPKWSAMYRWSVYQREDILYVLRGMWDFLGNRRKEQALAIMGLTEKELLVGNSPKEFRWDIMYQFANEVWVSVPEMLEQLKGHMKDYS